jgi:hypothetical protein
MPSDVGNRAEYYRGQPGGNDLARYGTSKGVAPTTNLPLRPPLSRVAAELEQHHMCMGAQRSWRTGYCRTEQTTSEIVMERASIALLDAGTTIW